MELWPEIGQESLGTESFIWWKLPKEKLRIVTFSAPAVSVNTRVNINNLENETIFEFNLNWK